MGKPKQGLVVISRLVVAVRGIDMPIETTAFDQIHAGRGHPVPLIIGTGYFAIGAHAHAIGCPVPIGNLFKL